MSKVEPVRFLMGSIIVIAMILWVFSVGIGIWWSFKGKAADFPGILSDAITLLGATLAANLGAVIGLSVSKTSGYSLNFRNQWKNDEKVKAIQIFAAYLYFIILLLSLSAYVKNELSGCPKEFIPSLVEMSRTFLGIVVGALAVGLGVKE